MKLLESKIGRVVFARLFEDEDLLEAVTERAKQSQIANGFFILIGSLKAAKLGFYRERRYEPIELVEPLEIVSCMGNISIKENEPFIHAHVSVSNQRGQVFGGHLLSGCIVAATAELVLIEAEDGKLERKLDEKTQLYLWSLSEWSSHT